MLTHGTSKLESKEGCHEMGSFLLGSFFLQAGASHSRVSREVSKCATEDLKSYDVFFFARKRGSEDPKLYYQNIIQVETPPEQTGYQGLSCV